MVFWRQRPLGARLALLVLAVLVRLPGLAFAQSTPAQSPAGPPTVPVSVAPVVRKDVPDYLRGLSDAERQRYGRRNVFPFSLSVAAHQTLQFVGLVSGMPRIGGTGPQHYAAYPGTMTVTDISGCAPDCEVNELTATAVDLTDNLPAARSNLEVTIQGRATSPKPI